MLSHATANRIGCVADMSLKKTRILAICEEDASVYAVGNISIRKQYKKKMVLTRI